MELRVLISGGGTGGHIFPAIAIADTLRAMRPDAKILFVGAAGKMEMEKVPLAGYEIVGLPIRGIRRSISVDNLKVPFLLLKSLNMARKLIRSFRPHVVVGVGGFASGPVLRVATWLSVPTLIQEQNSYPGLTNRLVAKSVNRICVAYDGMEKFFPKEKILKTGNPVRKEVVSIAGKRSKALDHFGLSPDKPIVLAVGGSLGAMSINKALHQGVEKVINSGCQLLWQCGKNFSRELIHIRETFATKGIVITEFIHEMDLAYAAADVIISRAGAIAVSELAIVGKPAILVPYPFAAEDHQTKNAQALVTTGAAILVPDTLAAEQLVDVALSLMKDKSECERLSQNITKHAMPDAAELIAQEILKLA